MVVNEEQSSKQKIPIEFTEFGIVMVVNEEQPSKQWLPIERTEFWNIQNLQFGASTKTVIWKVSNIS
jgi:hypothetical protein